MDKYIDREAAYRFAQDQLKKETGAYTKGWNNAMNLMKSAFHNNDAIPAADVVPVRHGHWLIKTVRGDKRTVCSECLLETGTCYEENYCPNCGAKMDGDGE